MGMDYDKFLLSTFRALGLKSKAYAKSIVDKAYIIRNIEFAIYNSAYAGMKGEKVFKSYKKPSDLYKLPGETDTKQKAFEGDAANDYMKQQFNLK